MRVWIFIIIIFLIAPGSITKPLQEETKDETKEVPKEKTKGKTKEKTKEKMILEIQKPVKDYSLPALEEVPVFMGKPLIIEEKGKTHLNREVAFALVASLTLTIKDVFRFSSSLDLAVDTESPGEQLLQMVDCRFSDIR